MQQILLFRIEIALENHLQNLNVPFVQALIFFVVEVVGELQRLVGVEGPGVGVEDGAEEGGAGAEVGRDQDVAGRGGGVGAWNLCFYLLEFLY